MSATDPLDDVALNTYEVEVPIKLDTFETTETASLTIAETAAQSQYLTKHPQLAVSEA